MCFLLHIFEAKHSVLANARWLAFWPAIAVRPVKRASLHRGRHGGEAQCEGHGILTPWGRHVITTRAGPILELRAISSLRR